MYKMKRLLFKIIEYMQNDVGGSKYKKLKSPDYEIDSLQVCLLKHASIVFYIVTGPVRFSL